MPDSNTLQRLRPDGRRFVSEPFMRGTEPLDDELAEFVEPLPGSPTADLEALDAVVKEAITTHSQFDTSLDGAIATDVHQILDITRRTAGYPGFWHWLAVNRYPDFVRHRWEYSTEQAMREKYLGAGSDLYSNAIHRLWWIAELTHDGDDYSLTNVVFDNQTMVNKVFDRWFARYRPAVIAICDELADEPSSVINDVTRRFNHALTNVQLEGLTEEDARELVQEILSDHQ
jgi:hypothetical protein